MPRSGKKAKSPRAETSQFPFLWRIAALGVILMSILLLSRSQKGLGFPEYGPGVYQVPCSGETWEGPKTCTPQSCSRAVFDDFITENERLALIGLMEAGLQQGDGGEGGAAIFDLVSGAVSQGRQFINAFEAMGPQTRTIRPAKRRFDKSQLDVFSKTVAKVQALVETNFGSKNPQLTPPCFFSRINGSKAAITAHDEYWHSHVDKLQYGSFTYTALLYLNNHGSDFEGGQFAFLDGEKSIYVNPKSGRLVLFTSGSENTHRVLPVTKGIRRAVTIAFTCNSEKGIKSFLKEAHALA